MPTLKSMDDNFLLLKHIEGSIHPQISSQNNHQLIACLHLDQDTSLLFWQNLVRHLNGQINCLKSPVDYSRKLYVNNELAPSDFSKTLKI